jgi:serine/threonine protein kinase
MDIKDIYKITRTNNLYINRANYRQWSKGGYGIVYLSNDNKKIYKRIEKYVKAPVTIHSDDEDNDDYNNLKKFNYKDDYIVVPLQESILEAVITEFLNNVFNNIEIYNISSSINAIYIKQKFCGMNLYSISNKNILYEYIPDIIYKLLIECYKLEVNGIQHTDISLANIIYSNNSSNTKDSDGYSSALSNDTIIEYDDLSEFNTHLIDYSCMSVKYVKNSRLLWTDTVGVWKYLDPQITLYENTSDTSVIWTIGIIICDLLKKMPFKNSVYSDIIDKIKKKENYKNYKTKSVWTEIYINIIKYDRLNKQEIFSEIYKDESIDDKYEYILKHMLIFENEKRISLKELITLWENMFEVDQIDISDIKPYHSKVHPCLIDRQLIVSEIYNFCKDCGHLDKFSYMVLILDKYSINILKFSINKLYLLIYSIWVLVSFIFMEQTKFYNCKEHIYIKNRYNIDMSMFEIFESLYSICENTNWKLYQKLVDVIIIENGYKLNYNILKNIFIHTTKPYSTYDIYDIYVKVLDNKIILNDNPKKRRSKSF